MLAKEKMIDEIVKTLGFENKWTVWFIRTTEDEKNSIQDLEQLKKFAIMSAEFEDEMED